MKFNILALIAIVLLCTQIYCISIERRLKGRRFVVKSQAKTVSKTHMKWWWLNKQINKWSELKLSVQEFAPNSEGTLIAGSKTNLKGKMSFSDWGLVLHYSGETETDTLTATPDRTLQSLISHVLVGSSSKFLIDYKLVKGCDFKQGSKAGIYEYTVLSNTKIVGDASVKPKNEFKINVVGPDNGGWGIIDFIHSNFYNDEQTLVNVKKSCDARMDKIKEKLSNLAQIVTPYVQIQKAYQGSKKMLYQARRDFFGKFYPVFEKQTAIENIDLDDIEGLVQSDMICDELENIRVQVNKGSKTAPQLQGTTGKALIYELSRELPLPLCASTGEKLIHKFFSDPFSRLKAKGTGFAIRVAKSIGAKISRMVAAGLSESEPSQRMRLKKKNTPKKQRKAKKSKKVQKKKN